MNFKSFHMKIVLLAFIIVVMFISLASDCSRSDTFNLSIGITGDGTVTPAEGSHRIERGATVDLTVKAAEGWEFDRWTGPNADDVIEDGENYKINMNSNKSITARFIEIEEDTGDTIIDDYQELKPGGFITGVDGVSIKAPEGALDNEIEVRIERIDTASAGLEASLPRGYNRVSPYYQISASRNLRTAGTTGLMLGLPPEDWKNIAGEDLENLAIAALIPPEGYMTDPSEENQKSMWIPLWGDYDEELELYFAPTATMRTEGRIYTLISTEEPPFKSVQPRSLGSSEDVGFVLLLYHFEAADITSQLLAETRSALQNAYSLFVEDLGFRDPRLRTHPHFLPGTWYEYELHSAGGCDWCSHWRGVYIFWENRAITVIADPADARADTTVHEFFHAIQWAYDAIDEKWNDNIALVEGTATAAMNSLEELQRTPRFSPLFVTASMKSSSYRSQDFWLYAVKACGIDLKCLEPLFVFGDIDHYHPNMSFGDIYWEWAKNQSFEKQVILGEDDLGRLVPRGDPYSWSGHGNLISVSFNPEAGLTGNAQAENISLRPLQSRVLEITLEPGEQSYSANISTAYNYPDISYKFYISEDNMSDDNSVYTIFVDEDAVTAYALISNKNISSTSVPVNLAISVNEINNISLSPPSPAILLKNQPISFTFDYKISWDWSEGVYIWGRPFTYGLLTPGYEASSSPCYPPGEGQGSGTFTLTNPAHVDEIRFKMRYSGIEDELILEFSLPVDYTFVHEMPLSFRDSNLEWAIRDKLGFSIEQPIYSSDVKYLEELMAANRNIKYLDGIEYLINLRTLNLSNNQILDISSIGSLKKLENLNLSNNSITDISILEFLRLPSFYSMKKFDYLLTDLDISNNSIYDLWPLNKTISLENLNCAFNSIISVYELENLINLKSLNISNNDVYDIDPLIGLNKLEYFNFNNNGIECLCSFGIYAPKGDPYQINYPELKALHCADNFIDDISPLQYQKHLKELDFSYNFVSDISPLAYNEDIFAGMIDMRWNSLNFEEETDNYNHLLIIMNRKNDVYFEPQRSLKLVN